MSPLTPEMILLTRTRSRITGAVGANMAAGQPQSGLAEQDAPITDPCVAKGHWEKKPGVRPRAPFTLDPSVLDDLLLDDKINIRLLSVVG